MTWAKGRLSLGKQHSVIQMKLNSNYSDVLCSVADYITVAFGFIFILLFLCVHTGVKKKSSWTSGTRWIWSGPAERERSALMAKTLSEERRRYENSLMLMLPNKGHKQELVKLASVPCQKGLWWYFDIQWSSKVQINFGILQVWAENNEIFLGD